VLFALCVVIVLAASRTAAAPDLVKLEGLTLRTVDRRAVRDSWDARDVLATAVVLGLVVALYLYFSFWI
jgi:SSS family solute:Na+ symporter